MMWTVVIPTFNEEKHIERLLIGLENIPTTNLFEVIVIDGGSEDATVSKAKKHGAKVYIMDEGNRGKQLKKGVEMSQGDYLWMLHADSTVPIKRDIFQEMTDLLSMKGTSAGFFPLFFRETNDLFFKYLSWTSNIRAQYLSLIFGDQGLFVSKKMYDQTKGYQSVPLMEDWLLSKELAKKGKFVKHSQAIGTSPRRFIENGKWRTHVKMHSIKLKFMLGIPTEKLAESYQKGTTSRWNKK